MFHPPRRSSMGCYHLNQLPSNTSSPRPAVLEAPAPLSPTPPLPLDRPLPQLFTRKVLPSQSLRKTERPPPLGHSFPTPICAPNTFVPESKQGRPWIGRAASNQHLECSQAGNLYLPSNPADMEHSKREGGLRETEPVCRGATYPPTSNSDYPSKLFSNTRSMTSIYQFVSTRVKGHAPATQKRDNLNGSTASRSIHYSPSLTGSDTASVRNYGCQSTTSVPSLSNSVSSQSTAFSSLSARHPTFSDDVCPLSPTPSSISSKLSLRSTSGSAINKSLQSLIRRRKHKSTDLNPSQPRSSLNIATNECRDIKPQKPMPKSAAASRTHFDVENTESGSPAMLFGSFPIHPLVSNDHPSSTLGRGHDTFKPPQTTVFSGSLSVSKDLPLAGTHPRQPAPKVVVRSNTSGSSGDDSEMEDMLANLRNIAATRKPVVPAAEKQPVFPESEGEDEYDSETEDIMTNLRSIATSRKPAGLTAEEQFTSLSPARPGSALLEDDQCSIACSESGSESSFEADVVADELPDHFPLPSWPKLDSTSQSPFTQQSLTSSAYRPAECSVSFSDADFS